MAAIGRLLPNGSLLRGSNIRLKVYKLSSTASAEVAKPVKTEPSKEELENEEPWMQKEIVNYYKGKNLLAKLMGQKPEEFTEKDVQEAVRYFLPSSLTAKDARPFLKHPSEVFPKRKEALFDSNGRPLEVAFYTGFPAYHNLIYEIYECSKILQCSVDHTMKSPTTSTTTTTGQSSDTGVKADTDSIVAEPDSHSETKSSVMSDSRSGSNVSNNQSDNAKVSSPPGGSLTTPLQWLKKDAMSNVLAEELSVERYEDLISRLTSLSSHPNSHVINEFLNKYRRPSFVYRSQVNLPKVNKDGYSYALGKRKTSVARVWVKKGSGQITVNERSFVDFFPKVEDRQQVLFPLLAVNQLGKWNIEAKIKGGGTTGQAGALRQGVSKALLGFKGDHVEKLERAGLLIRDPRMVERKKPGQKKARKKFAWVKR